MTPFFGLRQYTRHNRVADNISRVSVILLSRKRFEQMIEDKGERKKYMSIQLYYTVVCSSEDARMQSSIKRIHYIKIAFKVIAA